MKNQNDNTDSAAVQKKDSHPGKLKRQKKQAEALRRNLMRRKQAASGRADSNRM